MNDLQLGWLVGIIEGEGCFSYTQKYYETKKGSVKYRYARIKVTSTDEDVIDSLLALTSVGHKYGPTQPKNSKHKPVSWWTVTKKEDVLWLINTIEPHLMKRRKERARELKETINNS